MNEQKRTRAGTSGRERERQKRRTREREKELARKSSIL